MFTRNLGVAAVVAAVGVLAVSGPASAQTGNPFSCSAGTASVASGSSTLLAPTTANPSVTPCASDTAAIGNVTVPAGAGSQSANIGPIDSRTALFTSQLNGSTVYTEAEATSTVQALTMSGGGDTVAVGPSTATVDDRCVDDAQQLTASSTLNAITIDGVNTALSGQPQTFTTPDGLLTISVNQQTASGNLTTETLLEVSAASGGVELTAGTATAGATPGACAGTAAATGGGSGSGTGGSGTGGAGAGGSSGLCPSGATLGSDGCVVTGTSIAVPSTKSDELVGGSVMSLAAARRRFGKHVSCLTGAGPKFVVVGTKRANRITVRTKRMRVLGLGGNDHITVVGGQRTCVNGGAGNDTIVNRKTNDVTVFGSNGKDHITLGNGPAFVLGGKGNDTIVAGNGKVDIQGNAGNDRISVGNGAAHVNGGSGNDVLVAGTGSAHLNGGPGHNRITARGRTAYVQASRKGGSVAYVRRRNAAYARRHGIRKVHIIK
jgi:Ca2+-binding RTX toxin-like protein